MENGNHGDSQVSPGVMMSWMVAASIGYYKVKLHL